MTEIDAQLQRPETDAKSDWISVTQEMVNQFGTATLDIDPMHMDPSWAQLNSPFGGTIAYGFLTVSLLTHMLHSAQKHDKAALGELPEDVVFLNYGFDKLRLVSPVPTQSRVRGHFTFVDDTQRTRAGHKVYKFSCRVEIEQADSPALVGEWLAVGVPRPRVAVS